MTDHCEECIDVILYVWDFRPHLDRYVPFLTCAYHGLLAPWFIYEQDTERGCRTPLDSALYASGMGADHG